MSFHAYAHLTDKYLLLPHGSSMGDNYGPIVVARKDGPSSLDGVTVLIPGELTTAFLALRLFKPDVQYEVMPFDQIQDAVREGRGDGGTADPRRTADLRRRGPEEDRRPRRMVERAHAVVCRCRSAAT